MKHQDPSPGPEDPLGLRSVRRRIVAEARPQRHHGVDAAVGEARSARRAGGDSRLSGPVKIGQRGTQRGQATGGLEDGQARAQTRQLTGPKPAGPVQQDDLATCKWTEPVQGPRNLALHVNRTRESRGQFQPRVKRKVGHRSTSIGTVDWPDRRGVAQSGAMDRSIARMPAGLRFFLGYALLLLAGIGLSLRYVIDQAIDAPVSPIGVVWMALLAYTIFTITLVLQRKEAGRGFALGLATLTIPAVPLLAFSQLLPASLVVLIVAVVLFLGLTRPSVRVYLNEP